MRLINFNGTIHSENVPAIHSWNRAFRYGDGLFESIAVAKNSIPFLDDHWKRLTEGARLLSLELPADFTKESIPKLITELLLLNGIEGNAYARVMLYREGRGRYHPDVMRAGFVVEAEPIRGELFELNEKGLTIGLFPDTAKSIDLLSNFKTCSALVFVLASIYKSKSGWDDCLILNSRSNLVESTNSNFFLVKGKMLSTPSLAEGCINGVMRRQIMSLAAKNRLTVKETAIEPAMAQEADEMFLTNAVSGIRWVESYGNKRYGNEISTLLSDKLQMVVCKQETI